MWSNDMGMCNYCDKITKLTLAWVLNRGKQFQTPILCGENTSIFCVVGKEKNNLVGIKTNVGVTTLEDGQFAANNLSLQLY